jgi:hypothetical protein
MVVKKISAIGCFRYAQFVFALEVVLAIYWICVLGYAAAKDNDKLQAGILFGLHYAGLIALSGLIDDVEEKRNAILYKPKKSLTAFKGNGPTKLHVNRTFKIASTVSTKNDELSGASTFTEENERDFARGLERYPLSYGIALFVATISDTFSLADIILEHANGLANDTTFRLYAALFGIGLCLTISSIVWSIVFYSQLKSIARSNNEELTSFVAKNDASVQHK